jgi:hypothetical protein
VSGGYQFGGLCAGTYTVEVVTPAGFQATITNAPGSTGATDSNGSPATVTLPAGTSSDATIDFGFVRSDTVAPDTQILSGPTGDTLAASTTFTYTGTDDQTATSNLVFAWRLDGGAWSPFTPDTTATVTGLAVGSHVFEVKARDQAGNEDATPATRTFTVRRLSVSITDPPGGTTVPAGTMVVRGTVDSGGQEVGVIVNGVVAAVQEMGFAAQVPVRPGPVTLMAVATLTSGDTASASVDIIVAASETSSIALLANPSMGVAPLAVSFSIVGGPATIRVELDLDGDGSVEFIGATLDGQTFTYTRPGVYFSRATGVDAQGNRTTATALVEVVDLAALDGLLRAGWAAFKDTLRLGTIDPALAFVAQTERDGYRAMLNGLTRPLRDIDVILRDINFVGLYEGRAEYQMIRVDSGVRLSYLVVFVRDVDGVWRLGFF